MTILQLILIFLCASVLTVVAFRMLNLPPMLGYLSVGAIIAPYAKRWIPNPHGLESLADFGIVFLMFTIGLEFSLPKLCNMKRVVFGLGSGQVLLTTAIATIIGIFLDWSWQLGVIVGMALTMSSTAIGGKLLGERMELNTEHGRATIGIFLLQDMIVAPMLIVLPLLGNMPDDLYFQVIKAIIKIVVVFLLIFWLGKPIVSRWFRVVANRKSQELFMLNLLLVTLGFAYLTHALGLSMALGALLAGMLISETEFRFQIEEDIKPYRDILLGLFFITVGMMLDPAEIARNLPQVLSVLVTLLLFKGLVILGLGRLFGMAPGTSIRTALTVCCAGEFGFVIFSVCRNQLPPELSQPILAAMVLSMFIAPFLIIASDKIVMRLSKNEWLLQSTNITRLAAKAMERTNHVILCGYGRTGQVIARALGKAKIPYTAIDSDPELINQARTAGDHVEFGDCVRSELLVAAGLKRASAVVITFDSFSTAVRILHKIKHIRPDISVVVRAADDSNLDMLIEAGATEVIPEVFESALMLSAHTLAFCGIPVSRALRLCSSLRSARYGLLRGFFHGTRLIEEPEDGEQMLVHTIAVPEDAEAVGHSLAELNLIYPRIIVSAIRRDSTRLSAPSADTRIEPNDKLMVIGHAAEIADAEDRLLVARF